MRIGDELKQELGSGDTAFDQMVRQTLDGLETEERPVKKTGFGLILALVIVMVLGVTALAAGNGWSVLLNRLPGVQCTPEAVSLVQPVEDVTWENDDVRLVVHEMLYDGYFLYLYADVFPQREDVVLLDWLCGRENIVRPESPASLLNVEAEEGMTVQTYCENNGLVMVEPNVTFYLQKLGWTDGWLTTYEHTDREPDGQLTIVVSAAYAGAPEDVGIFCSTVHQPYDPASYSYEVMPLNLTRTDSIVLDERSCTQIVPVDETNDMRLEGVRVVKTPIDCYVDLTWSTVIDAPEDIGCI